MAAAVHKLLNVHHRSGDTSSQASQPATSPHERPDSAMDRARDSEKHALAQWGDRKQPLEPDQVDEHPDRKTVGHSSNVLRQEDFELIKTLGTGMQASAPRPPPAC